MNKVLEITLSDIDHVICVSHTWYSPLNVGHPINEELTPSVRACVRAYVCMFSRENLVIRARLHPSQVFAIPNAVDPTKFVPNTSLRYPTHTGTYDSRFGIVASLSTICVQ
jgi:hypothetical protein